LPFNEELSSIEINSVIVSITIETDKLIVKPKSKCLKILNDLKSFDLLDFLAINEVD